MKIIYLKFLDHSADPDKEWKDISELSTNKVSIELVGFLASEDEDHYHMIQAINGSDFTNSFSVLKSTVLKKKEWKLKK